MANQPPANPARFNVKNWPSHLWRSLLASRRTVLNAMRPIENVMRALLRETGVKLGMPSRKAFADKVCDLADNDSAMMPLGKPLLSILVTN